MFDKQAIKQMSKEELCMSVLSLCEKMKGDIDSWSADARAIAAGGK